MNTQLVMEIPNESLLAFNGSIKQTGEELRMAAATKLYELGRMSSGAAARLAGIPRAVFLGRLGEYDINSFKYGAQEFEKETRLA